MAIIPNQGFPPHHPWVQHKICTNFIWTFPSKFNWWFRFKFVYLNTLIFLRDYIREILQFHVPRRNQSYYNSTLYGCKPNLTILLKQERTTCIMILIILVRKLHYKLNLIWTIISTISLSTYQILFLLSRWYTKWKYSH